MRLDYLSRQYVVASGRNIETCETENGVEMEVSARNVV